MTPARFLDRMRSIKRVYPDSVSRYRAAVALLSDALSSNGYSKGIAIFREIEDDYLLEVKK